MTRYSAVETSCLVNRLDYLISRYLNNFSIITAIRRLIPSKIKNIFKFNVFLVSFCQHLHQIDKFWGLNYLSESGCLRHTPSHKYVSSCKLTRSNIKVLSRKSLSTTGIWNGITRTQTGNLLYIVVVKRVYWRFPFINVSNAGLVNCSPRCWIEFICE